MLIRTDAEIDLSEVMVYIDESNPDKKRKQMIVAKGHIFQIDAPLKFKYRKPRLRIDMEYRMTALGAAFVRACRRQT
jgi:hypothetical protein